MPYRQFNHSSGAPPSPSSPTTQTAIRQSKLPEEGLFENKLFNYGENLLIFKYMTHISFNIMNVYAFQFSSGALF